MLAESRGNKSEYKRLHISDDKIVEEVGTVVKTDNELFLKEAFQKDEWLGCSLVFEHYYAPLCSHAIRYVYSREYAEDIVAEVFKEFWQKKHFRSITISFRTYLYRAVRNRSLNHSRREFKQSVVDEQDLTIPSAALRPDEMMMYDQLYQKIQSGIDGLPPKCRKIFLMSRFEGKKLKEIAELQNISIRTVETHISKALSILREVVKDNSQD